MINVSGREEIKASQLSFFIQYGKKISIPSYYKENTAAPFNDHPQFPILVDILSRKNFHHVILYNDFITSWYDYWIAAFLHYLSHHHAPYSLQNIEVIYLDIDNFRFSKTQQKKIAQDFIDFQITLTKTDKTVVFLLNNRDLFPSAIISPSHSFLSHQFKMLMPHPQCRFLLLSTIKNDQHVSDNKNNPFIFLHLLNPSVSDKLIILKQQVIELEKFHRILIPEDLLFDAYRLTQRFLSTNNTLAQALLLLDSSAAHIAINEPRELQNQIKPVLTLSTITNVLARWTQIPAIKLLPQELTLNEFIYDLQQQIFGQDIAISILGHELQRSQSRALPTPRKPFGSFLFIGPPHTGKKTFVIMLTEQLFKQTDVLFTTPIATSASSFADIKMQAYKDNGYICLKDLIQQKPYAILLFENIEQLSTIILDGLQEILQTGFLHDEQGNQYDFCQAIIVLTSSHTSVRLMELTKTLTPEEEPNLGLLQLVMDKPQPIKFSAYQYSPEEITEEISLEISKFLPVSLSQYVHIVPFLPLHQEAIEKIVRLKMKLLTNSLMTHHGIELSYAPEIIQYLIKEIRKKERDQTAADKDKIFKQLSLIIEKALLNQTENNIHSHHLFLQLTEHGQALRCNWLNQKQEFSL